MVLKNDQTVVSAFRRQAAARAESVALWGRGHNGWRSWSWKQWEERARQAAAAFVQLGVEPGDRVALLLGTRPEWAVLEQGILQAGGIVCSLYPANPIERTCFMLEDAGARVAVCEGASRARELLQQRARLPRLEHVICFEPEPEPGERSGDAVLAAACWRGESGLLPSLPQLFALGEQRLSELRPELERRERQLHPAGWASLYYTSGTTRVPKGVRLSHTNLLYSSQVCADGMRRESALMEPGSILLVAAPLAHLLGRINLGLIITAARARRWRVTRRALCRAVPSSAPASSPPRPWCTSACTRGSPARALERCMRSSAAVLVASAVLARASPRTSPSGSGTRVSL